MQGSFHISLDDVGPVLSRELKASSTTLSDFIGETGAKYNIIWGLNFFTRWTGGSIFDVDLFDSVDWRYARIGPHALEAAQAPYAIDRESNLAWLREFLSEVFNRGLPIVKGARFHFYSELYECTSLLADFGIQKLFLTDREVVSYGLPTKEREELKRLGKVDYAGVELQRTHFRLEWLREKAYSRIELKDLLLSIDAKENPLVIYGHEYEFEDADMYRYTDLILDVLVHDMGYSCTVP